MALGMNVHGQAPNISVSLGPEWNMNSRENFAGGVVLGFDYNFLYFHPCAAGLTVTAGSNFDGFTAVEAVAMLRWYYSEGEPSSGLFGQPEMGVYFILENETVSPIFDGGIRAGYRIHFNPSFYFEPYGRLGYPFVFGIGVTAGVRL
jgi:hypothetical protein